MTKIKFNILQVFMIVFCLSIGLVSCTTDEQSKEVASVDIENFNTLENRQAITNLFQNQKEQEKFLKEYGKNANFTTTLQKNQEENIEVLLAEYEECSDCANDYKAFLVPMFEELIDLDDNEIISKIESYELLIDNYSTDENIRENLEFMLFTFKEATNYKLNNPNESKYAAKDSIGTSIGRGMVTGFLSGCAAGGYAGFVAGTVTVPVIGTVVGAVSGCIAAGAVGSVYGAIAGAFWGWASS
jgi:hypothetical protein